MTMSDDDILAPRRSRSEGSPRAASSGKQARGLIDVIDTVREDADGRVQFHYTLVDFAAEEVDLAIRLGRGD